MAGVTNIFKLNKHEIILILHSDSHSKTQKIILKSKCYERHVFSSMFSWFWFVSDIVTPADNPQGVQFKLL